MSLNKGVTYAKDVAPIFNGDVIPTAYGWAIQGNDRISVDVVSNPSETQASRDEMPLFIRHKHIQVRSNDTGVLFRYISDEMDNDSWINTNNWLEVDENSEGGTGVENTWVGGFTESNVRGDEIRFTLQVPINDGAIDYIPAFELTIAKETPSETLTVSKVLFGKDRTVIANGAEIKVISDFTKVGGKLESTISLVNLDTTLDVDHKVSCYLAVTDGFSTLIVANTLISNITTDEDGKTPDLLAYASRGDVYYPDDEDMENVEGFTKFKNRNSSGVQKGYKIIRSDFDFADIPSDYANSILEIRYAHDLLQDQIILPDNVELRFNGGALYNGELVFSNTKFSGDINFTECVYSGTIGTTYLKATDFGASANDDSDCSSVINNLITLEIEAPSLQYGKTIHLTSGTYRIDNPIIMLTNFDRPVTLEGDGIGTIIKQYSNNEYIIKHYEVQYIKKLHLTYNEQQTSLDPNSIALASGRSIFSRFEDIQISNCHTGIGYVKVADLDSGGKIGPFVNNVYDTIRILDFEGYGINTTKEVSGGDTGSWYNNIYLNQGDGNTSIGFIRMVNTEATFGQLNLEGGGITTGEALIYATTNSVLNVGNLHIEGVDSIKKNLIYLNNSSLANIQTVELQFSSVEKQYYRMLRSGGTSNLNVGGFQVRENTKNISEDGGLDGLPTSITNYLTEIDSTSSIILGELLDASNFIDQISDSLYGYFEITGRGLMGYTTAQVLASGDNSIVNRTVMVSDRNIQIFKTSSGIWINTDGYVTFDTNGDYATRRGTTALRPILDATSGGFYYFDTTLAAPLWWDGDDWINASGTIV